MQILTRVRLLPLTICVAVGMVQGFRSAAEIVRAFEYVPHGLYNTAARILVTAIDLRVGIVCLSCFITWLAYTVRSRMKGGIRRVGDLVMLFGILIVLNVDLFSLIRKGSDWVLEVSKEINAGTVKDIIGSGISQIIISALVLTVGVFLLARVRARNSNATAKTGFSSSSGAWSTLPVRVWAAARYLWSVLERHWELSVIVFILFTGLNLVAGWYRVSNTLFLRHSPNVILIQIDTLRADHLGCYEYSSATSPNIDKFASECTRFSKAISAAPWTSASMAQYMTSRNMRVRFESQSAFSSVPQNAVLLSEALKDRGYATAGITSNLMAGPDVGFDRGMDSYDQRYADITSPKVLSTALQRLNNMKDRKFYLFALFMDPHSPYTLHDEHNFYPGYKGKLGKEVSISIHQSSKDLTIDDLKYMRSVYDSEIAFTDEYVGRLLDELRRMDLYDDTLIILLSDHGEEFGEHGRLEHGLNLYDETLSVPLIIKLPGQHKGKVVGGVFSLLDLFPSIIDALGMDSSAFGLQGVARHLAALTRMKDEGIYSSTEFGNSTNVDCIRRETCKLIEDKNSLSQELYNLQADPGERQNELRTNPKLVSVLHGMLKERDKEINNAENGAKYQSTVDLIKSRSSRSKTLRSLGYLQ